MPFSQRLAVSSEEKGKGKGKESQCESKKFDSNPIGRCCKLADAATDKTTMKCSLSGPVERPSERPFYCAVLPSVVTLLVYLLRAANERERESEQRAEV